MINLMLILGLSLACGQKDTSKNSIPTVGEFQNFLQLNDRVTTADETGWVGIYDPKYGRWRRLLGANFSKQDGKTDVSSEHPLSIITWEEAHDYCSSIKKRLPSLEESLTLTPIPGLLGEWTESPYTKKENRPHFESAMLINGHALDGYFIRTYSDTLFNVPVLNHAVPAESRYGLVGIGCRCVD